jgi:hypothetical protein
MPYAPSGSNKNRRRTTTRTRRRDCIIIFKSYHSMFSSKLKHVSIATNKSHKQKARKGRIFLFSHTEDIPNKDNNSSKRDISCVTCGQFPVAFVSLIFIRIIILIFTYTRNKFVVIFVKGAVLFGARGSVVG